MTVIVIGAGIAGLAAALQLAHAGRAVTVIEAHGAVGGKIRTLDTLAGPVDAGPTVLTMRDTFEKLFQSVGETLTDHLQLIPQNTLARHFWRDGTVLDLTSDPQANHDAIDRAFGRRAAQEFKRFNARTKTLFDAFKDPMMFAPSPSQRRMRSVVLSNPGLIPAMAPHRSMAGLLRRSFSDPRLAQLFGRYATYVGGAPDRSPALLSLIWQAEATGVWQAKGGMHALARALHQLAETRGARFILNTPVHKLLIDKGRICGVSTRSGQAFKAETVVFNGDPAALRSGLLGPEAIAAVPAAATEPRSHSAAVWSFAAVPSRSDLALHNVFFGADPLAEFKDLAVGRLPRDPTLYVYAQDRGAAKAPTGPERFEIIMNAPPTKLSAATQESPETCRNLTFSSLGAMGLSFSPNPQETLTTPMTFNTLFPASAGALYGRSPQGLMAAFKRPTARSKITGLYLAGGGCHPGAGVPMATLSGMHAAAAILTDQTLTSTSRQMATPGGMSTGSQTMRPAQSPSSVS
ncbi:MAG: phytoene desaturase family protein [Rhodobacteraceae bacterium]|nr:phytoene desaturase family protein [Paracoccaceae bacterium]